MRFVLFLCLLIPTLLQASPVVLKSTTEALTPNNIQVHRDLTGRYTLKDIQASDNWQACDCERLDSGEGFYWFSFELLSESADTWILRLENPLLVDARLYIQSQDISAPIHFEKIHPESPTKSFKIRYSTAGLARVFIKVNANNVYQFPVKIWHESKIDSYIKSSALTEGGVIGVLLAFLLFNLTILAATREAQVASLLMFIGSMGLIYFSQNGHIGLYLPEMLSLLAIYSVQISLALSALLGALFSVQFLQHLERKSRSFSVLSIVLVCSLFITPLLSMLASSLMMLCVFLGFLVMAVGAGIKDIRRGNEGAEYFVLASICFMLGAILHALHISGVVSSPITSHALSSAILISTLLYSVANYIKMSQQRMEIAKDYKCFEDAQEEVMKKSEYYRSLYNNALEAMFSFSRDGTLIRYNPAFVKLTGINVKDKTKKNIKPILLPDNDHYSVFNEMLQRDGQVMDFVSKAGEVAGMDKWFSITVVAVSKAEGVEYEAVAIDVSERINNGNKQLHSKEIVLEQMQHKMDNLSALIRVVAHEINAPVDKTFGFVSQLDARVHDFDTVLSKGMVTLNELRNLVNDCEDSSELAQINLKKAARIIQDLNVMLSDEKTEVKTIELDSYLANNLQSLQVSANDLGHNFQVFCPNGIRVKADLSTLLKVLHALVNNALHSAFEDHQKGRIELRVSLESNELNLTISDNGLGINSLQKKAIIDPMLKGIEDFGRVQGIELFMAYNLVKLKLQGNIECLSEEHEGTTFIINVPVETK